MTRSMHTESAVTQGVCMGVDVDSGVMNSVTDTDQSNYCEAI